MSLGLKPVLFSIAIILISGCNETEQTDQLKIDQLLIRSNTFKKQGQFKAAIIEARNLIKLKPADSLGLVPLAQIYIKIGRGKQAIQILQQVEHGIDNRYHITQVEAFLLSQKYQSALAVLKKNEVLLQRNLPVEFALLKAKAYAGLGKLAKSEEWIKRTLELEPDNSEVSITMALLEARRKNFDITLKLADKVLSNDPNNIDALTIKSSLALHNNNLEKAEDLLSEALTNLPNTDIITPKRAAVLRMLSDILSRQGRSAEAMIYSKILAEAFPGSQEIESHFNKAIELYKQGKLDESEDILVDILQQAPGNERIGTLLGVINYLQNETEEAEKYFATSFDAETATTATKQIFALTQLKLKQPDKVMAALEADIPTTNNIKILSLYGIAALSSNQIDKGLSTLKRSLSINPSQVKISLILARHYNSLPTPEHENALNELIKAYKNVPNNPYVQSAILQQYITMAREDDAKKMVEEILSKKPDQLNSQLIAASFYGTIEDHEKSKQYFQAAIKLDPKDLHAQYGLAQVSMALNDWQTADQTYQQIIQLSPEQLKAYKGIIHANESGGMGDQGVEKVQLLAKSFSTNYEPYAVLAEYYVRNKKIQEALKYLAKAQEISNGVPYLVRLTTSIYYLQSQLAVGAKDYALARQAAIQALQSTPSNARVMTLLANIEIQTGQGTEARKIIQEIRTIHPTLAIADFLTGDLALKESNLDQALSSYRAVWKVQKNNTVARKIYGLLKNTKKTTKAEAFLNEWEKELPNSTQAKIILAMALQSDGKNGEAIKRYESIIKKTPDNPMVLNNLAWLYHLKGEPKALELAKKAYDFSPRTAAIADTYGWILLHNGEKIQAVVILNEAATMAPDNTEIRNHLKQAKGT